MNSNYERAVFVSYAWGDESEDTVNELEQAFAQRGIKIIRDKRDLGYRGSIQEFMERIGGGDCVIVVVSDKYLRSPNCMFELVEIAENKQFHDRIFPIVLPDANIYDPVKRLGYVSFWEAKRAELAEAMKNVDPANLQGIREEIDNYDRFRDKISGLTSILKDMNTLTPEMLKSNGFSTIIKDIAHALGESDENDLLSSEIELEFANQLQLRNSLSPSLPYETQINPEMIYALIIAPIQQGKTRVLNELKNDYHKSGWSTEYFDIQEIGDENPVKQIFKKKGVSIPLTENMNEYGANFFTQYRQKEKEKPLSIFIDTRKMVSSDWVSLANFLEGIWRKAKDAFGGENLAKNYRVFITSRDAELLKIGKSITHLKYLPLLSYQDVSQAIEKALRNRDVNSQAVKNVYSYDIFYLSGGHPGIIDSIVRGFGPSAGLNNLEDFLRVYRQQKWKIDIRNYAEKAFQETVVNTINDIESVRAFSQKICAFRYFDKTSAGIVLDSINQNKALDNYLGDLFYDEAEDGLYDGLYTDGVIRDLVALDMLLNESELFSTYCIEAKKLCLKQIETTRSVLFISEYMFQSFQFLLAEKGGNINLWDGETREEIKNAFKKDFIDFLNKLKGLYPGHDRNDVCKQMRNQIQKALELHYIKSNDEKTVINDERLRSFRFIVNFVYKQDNQDFESGWNIFEGEISNLIQAHMLVAGG